MRRRRRRERRAQKQGRRRAQQLARVRRLQRRHLLRTPGCATPAARVVTSMEAKAVTGLGVVSAVGIGREAFFRALAEPVPVCTAPLRPIESFDASAYPDPAIVE